MIVMHDVKATAPLQDATLQRHESSSNHRFIAAQAIRDAISYPSSATTRAALMSEALDSLSRTETSAPFRLPISAFPFREDNTTSHIVLDKEAISKVLASYNVGEVVNVVLLERSKRPAQRGYIVTTTEGKFYLKQYSNFDEQKRMSLFLVEYLQKGDFPVAGVVQTMDGMPYTIHDRIAFALFDYVDVNTELKVTVQNAEQLGATLGRLHVLTSKFPSEINNRGMLHLRTLFEFGYKRKDLLDEMEKRALEILRIKLDDLMPPVDSPKAMCHYEFMPRHAGTVNGRVVGVIDWDNI